ncbi:MAG TPA: response regulator transcription factor [Blastocatellia bacterium]|nr:response regulator transcription factor [Blastocatellia bacterium]
MGAATNHAGNGQKPIRILLVDNHEMIRTALRLLIEMHDRMIVVGEASGRDDAVAVATVEQPDITVVNFHVGSQEGFEFIPDLHVVARKTRVLVLTGVLDPDIHTRAMLCGAIGVVPKGQGAGVLVKALEKVSEGEAWIDRTTIANVLSELSNRNGSTEVDSESAKIASLTRREKEVVSLVCSGLRNKEIGSKLCISVATVRHHLGSIFSKLDLSGRLDLIIYASRHGLIDLRGPDRGV